MLRITTTDHFRTISQDLELFHSVHESLQLFLDEKIINEDLIDEELVQLIENDEKPLNLEDTHSFHYYEQILKQTLYISDSDKISQEDLLF